MQHVHTHSDGVPGDMRRSTVVAGIDRPGIYCLPPLDLLLLLCESSCAGVEFARSRATPKNALFLAFASPLFVSLAGSLAGWHAALLVSYERREQTTGKTGAALWPGRGVELVLRTKICISDYCKRSAPPTIRVSRERVRVRKQMFDRFVNYRQGGESL